MAGDSGSRRVATLKTYSRRVKRSLPVPAGKNTSEGDILRQKPSAEGVQRRVSSVADENQISEGGSQSPRKRQQGNKLAPNTTITASQRQVLLEVDPNHVNSTSSAPPFRLLHKGDPTSPSKAPTPSQRPTPQNKQSKHVNESLRGTFSEKKQIKDPRPANSPLSAPDKAILRSVNEPSPGKTRQNRHLNTPNSSYQATEERPVLGSATQPSRKRRKPAEPDPGPSPAKKVKCSSIKCFFKPLPTSSSPSTTRSINIFSDNVEAPSSPPTSPLSRSESPKFQTSRKKTRRTLSLKPSLPPSDTMKFPIPPIGAMTQGERSNKDIGELVGKKSYETTHGNCVERVVKPHTLLRAARLYEKDWRGVETGRSNVVDDSSWSTRAVTSSADDDSWDARAAAKAQWTPPVPDDQVTTGDDIDDGIPRSAPIDIPKKKKKSSFQVTFHQTRLISDVNTQIHCDDCGMDFDRTVESDLREHARFHDKYTYGDHLTKARLGQPLLEEANLDGFVHRIFANERGTTLKGREWYEIALKISLNRGLDGPSITDLWREINDPSVPQSVVPTLVPKYKVYVYTKGDEVVCVILAKRIAQAAPYYLGPKTHDENGKLATPDETKTQEYVNLDQTYPAMVSVDRIWTRADNRRKGYATRLLKYVRKDFIPGMKLHRCQVAFSLLTAEGSAFATKYCSGVFTGTPFVIDVEDPRVVVENGKLKDRWAIPRFPRHYGQGV